MGNIFLFFAVALVMTTCWASPLQTFASSELRTRSEVSVMKILREQNESSHMEKSALVDALQQALGSTLTGEEMENREDKSYCHCQKNACACCVDLKIKKAFIHFEGKACVNVQFLPSELAIQAEVTFNDKVLWKKKVSGKNPPEICLPIPKMKKASLCIKFHDLSYQSHQVSGCIGLSVKIAGGQVYKVELGCFKIPPSEDALEVTGTPGIPATSEISSLETEKHQHDILKAILEQPEMIEAFQKALRGLSLTDEELTDQGNNSMCQCHGTACGCCVKINVKKVVHFSGEACVNVRYLPTHIGVEADVTWNGKVLFKKEISVKNPPPICMPVPEFPAVALCVQFHDLSFHDHKASGCIDVSVKAVHITVFKVKLGCFHIPPNEENVALLEDQSQIALDQHSPVQHAWMSTPEAEDQDQIAKKLFETFVQTDVDLEKTSLCVCMDGTCTCCLHFASSADDAVCAQFQSVSETMDVTLLVNDQAIINEQVAVRNPTRTCVSTEGGQQLANLCLSLTNLDVQSLSFSGCAELEADLVGMTIKKRTIGCFDSLPEQLTPETKMIVY